MSSPDPAADEQARRETMEELLECERSELVRLRDELATMIDEWDDEYNSTPQELRENTHEHDRETMWDSHHWVLAEYRLELVNEAIRTKDLSDADIRSSTVRPWRWSLIRLLRRYRK